MTHPRLGRPVVSLLADVSDEEWQSAWRAWAAHAGDDVLAAWDRCPRGSWMLLMARRLEMDRMPLMLATVDCLDDALTQSTDLHSMMAPMCQELRSAVVGERTAAQIEALTRKATQEAAAARMHAHDAVNDDARARFERWALALRALAGTCEELAWLTRTGVPRSIWPPPTELLARALSLSALPRRRAAVHAASEARFAEHIRRRIPGFLVELHLR